MISERSTPTVSFLPLRTWSSSPVQFLLRRVDFEHRYDSKLPWLGAQLQNVDPVHDAMKCTE